MPVLTRDRIATIHAIDDYECSGDVAAALSRANTALQEAWDEIDRLRAALVEERASNHASWVTEFPVEERHRVTARAELVAEGLLPPE